MLPNVAERAYAVESTISSLYRNCRDIDALDKSQSDLLLKQAIKSVGELPKRQQQLLAKGRAIVSRI